jgi:glutamate formiminotransferase / formiminotetrahydrofolate cyclodeaminase
VERLPDQTLAAYLEAVAEATPAPGAGSVCAVTCALAAGLVEMAAGIGDGDLDGPRAARARALELAEVELGSYAAVLEAMRLPRDDPRRGRRVEAALVDACGAPLEIAELAAEVAESGYEVAVSSGRSVRGDALAGVTLAEAAAAAAGRLVEINLAGLDAEGAGELRERARAASRAARAVRQNAEVEAQ